MRWMNLEPIIQSEVSQKEKDKYHILTYIYMESRKMILVNLFARQQWKIDTENRHGEKAGEDEMYVESNMENDITICKIDSQSNLLYLSGNSNRGSVST